MSDPRVAIIILNWNGWRDTVECLESVYQIDYSNYDVVVVDNGSTDNSVEKIKEYCNGKVNVISKFFKYNPNNKPIHILEYTRVEAERGGNFRKEKYFSKLPSNRKLRFILNEKNLGFAEGNNVAIRYVLKSLDPEYVLLLNNDAQISNDCVKTLVEILEKYDDIGLVQPKVLKSWDTRLIDSTGHIWKFGIKRNNWNLGVGYIVDRGEFEVDEKQYDSKVDIVSCCACVCMYRSKMLREIGLFREDFFAYCEDVELSWRAGKYGWRANYVSEALAYHKRGQTRKKFDRQCAELRRINWAKTLKLHGNLVQILFLAMLWELCYILGSVGIKKFELDSDYYLFLIKFLLNS